MLLLILAILSFLIYGSLTILSAIRERNANNLLYTGMCLVLSLMLLLPGMLITVQHENSYTISEEIALVSLSNTSGISSQQSLFYVSINSENVYTYRYQIENYNKVGNGNLETAYIVDTVKGWVTEIESSECSSPVLYVREYKNTWGVFRLGFGYTTEYVFYVPVDTIAKDIALK